MLIIGLGHEAQHGKDTFADAVYAKYKDSLDIRLISFADALRKETHDLSRLLWVAKWGSLAPFNGHEAMRLLLRHFDKEELFEEKPLVDVTYPYGKQRKFLQWYGTDYRRKEFGDDYWIRRADDKVEEFRTEGANVVIFRDMRFDNEYEYIGSKGGYRIKVKRLNFDNGVPKHESETALANHTFDLQLHVSDGMLDVLLAMAPAMFAALYRRELDKEATPEAVQALLLC